jgi:putative Mg2+ transporter-C (MgtC) family protein
MNGAADIGLKIGLTALLAGILGAEREWAGKFAGMRTHILIAMGATLLASISHATGAGGASWDGGRIAAQIVSGVGFIGAGTILQARGAIHGLTTAAGLWVAAAIGIAVGSGFYIEASATTAAMLIVLTVLRPLEQRMLRSRKATIMIRLQRGQKVADLAGFLEEEGVETENVSIERRTDHPVVTVTFRGNEDLARQIVERACLKGFTAVEEAAPVLAPGVSAPVARKHVD